MDISNVLGGNASLNKDAWCENGILKEGPRTRQTLSKVLNGDEKWLDLLPQGYYLCNKHAKLLYSNKQGESIMSELEMRFEEMMERLVSVENGIESLKSVIGNLFASEKKKAALEQTLQST